MEFLGSINGILLWGALGITLVRSYLTLNKVWTRKDNAEVADSISVYAAILGLVAALPFFIQYLAMLDF